MNNGAVIDLRSSLPRMLVFGQVVEAGSFSGAAKRLSMSRAAVSNAVAALEGDLGVSLLHRTTRSLRMTDAGEELLESCRKIQAVGHSALEEVAALGDTTAGTLRVTSPGGFIADKLVVPVLATLAREHGVVVELDCSDTRQPLVGGGYDAAIRVGTPRDSGLVMRRVGKTREVIVASPELASRVSTATDLSELPWVIHKALPRQFTLVGPGRRRTKVVMQPQVLVNDSVAMLGLVRGGAGLALVPRIALDVEVERGGLVEVFPDRHTRSADIFVLMPSRKRVPKGVRLLTDGLKAALATG